jgi:hypothetical protein
MLDQSESVDDLADDGVLPHDANYATHAGLPVTDVAAL